uniref:Wnt receptor frizzled-like protein 4/9/10 n=1 Tax=Bugula neritina TaxID=10212 RepID=I6WNQ0_BUGNE|nr:Wnt receptor frizzled-like protein 4/9/10 [Bugula neritina]
MDKHKILKPYSVIFLTVLIFNQYQSTSGYIDDMGRCEPIRIDMCSHLKYNMTSMPNSLGHISQEEVIAELRPYSQLVNLFNCSQHIEFFLCSLFVPMCTMQMDGPLVINVCRSMCLQVKSDCDSILKKLEVRWPLNCSELPESNVKEQLCMAPRGNQLPSHGLSTHTPPDVEEAVTRQRVSFTEVAGITPKQHTPSTSCPDQYVRYENRSCTNLCDPACKDCVPKCQHVFYTQKHKNFAYTWMAIWASLCIASTLFTILTFCIDPRRFRYPTRPVIFMAFCYLIYALSYFIPLFIPREKIICKSDVQGDLMVVNGMESTLCVIIFLVQYYFGIASHVWWLILTFTWYLAASRKWVLEAINSIACYFHLFAWAVPAVLTVVILVTGRVDSNELTGMCYVGNHDKWSLLIYIIIPTSFLCLVGEILMLAGFVSVLRIRTNLKTHVDDASVRKLEKLMAKIGVFAIFYTVPTVCVLGSNIHEFINMDTWRCMSSLTSTLVGSIPTVEIHILKISMSLIVGVFIAMWVLNSKTLQTCERKCSRKSNNSRLLHQSQYNNKASYVIAKQTDCNGYVKHYKFPASHHVISASPILWRLGPDALLSVNL